MRLYKDRAADLFEKLNTYRGGQGVQMDRKSPSAWWIAAGVVAAAMLMLGFDLVLAVAFPPAMAQSQSTAPSNAGNSPAGGNLVVVGADVRDKTINFGDELVVIVHLENRGKKPITIPPDELLLKNVGWSGYPGFGSGMGESALARAGVYPKEEFAVQPGESVTLIGSNTEMGVETLGPMKASFILKTENQTLSRELGKPAEFSVSYYVAPSKLLISTWNARTAGERQRLQPEIREILLVGSKDEEWRDRNFVEGTLRFMGCYASPLLESAMKDSDPIVRQQAVVALQRSAWNSNNLNFFIADLLKKNEGQSWAASVGECEENHALRETVRLASAGLNDGDPRVRIAAIAVLTDRASEEANLRRWRAEQRGREPMDERTKQIYDTIGLVDPALPLVKKMTSDMDPSVRAEAQKFLSNFASKQEVAGDVVVSLTDSDAEVRSQALQALKKGHEPPPMAALEKAFASTKGEVALGLIELMYEREDSQLAARLTPGFKERSAAERLMILTAVAGHTDDAAWNLVTSGLKDGDIGVRRAALMRLLAFPSEKALSVISADSAVASGDVGTAILRELGSRALFPFLARRGGSAVESIFPSIEGTGPMVSPDGKWVAYVETGWGRPGGSGGMGRSNLLSITHVASIDGRSDRVVSDMFLVGWMSDSRRVGSSRDGCAAIVNLNGKVVTEFGDPLDKSAIESSPLREAWPQGTIREQFGARMPHSKRFQTKGDDSEARFDFDYGEDAAFSPDGKWFGPRRVKDQWQFIDPEGNKRAMKATDTLLRGQAVWSPDGAHVIVFPAVTSGSFGADKVVEPAKAIVIDPSGPSLNTIVDVDQVWSMGGWNYRKGRWNPWSKDGKRLAFVRQGQVWTSDPDGNAAQLTFDASNKIFPTFSPDGAKVAYITWQFDNREHYTRLGPTDIWVVDIKTGLAARVTRPDPGRISGLDWLDSSTLIYDRLQPDKRQSTLRIASLR